MAEWHQNPRPHVQQSPHYFDSKPTDHSHGLRVSSHDYIDSNEPKKDACQTFLRRASESFPVPVGVEEHRRGYLKYSGSGHPVRFPHPPDIRSWRHTKPNVDSVVQAVFLAPRPKREWKGIAPVDQPACESC